jgi:hypothetical protein
VRADVAIHRMRAPARGRSRRLRSRKGSCTKKRRGIPADGTPSPTFTSRPAPLPQQLAPSDREPRPVKGLPILDRPPAATPTPPEGEAPASPRPFTTRGEAPAPCRDPLGPKGKSSMRTTWPSTSTTEASAAEPCRPKPPTPDDLPWEGRQPPANTRKTSLSLHGRAKPGTRPDAFAYWPKG